MFLKITQITNRFRAFGFLALACLVLAACGGSQKTGPASSAPDISLVDYSGTSKSLQEVTRHHDWTVFEFFSAECPTQLEHDAYLKALAKQFKGPKVQFIAVNSEISATLQINQHEAQTRGYDFPIMLDTQSLLAKSVGARYTTFVVVMDKARNIHYKGGIDSDRTHLSEGRERYLENALADLLSGHAPKKPEGKALGCSLSLAP